MTNRPEERLTKTLATNLKMLLLDVDGVLTDGGIILISEDQEAKRFDVKDGIGIALAKACNIKIGIVTSRTSAVVRRRAQELNIDELFQGVQHKPDVLIELERKYGFTPSQLAYVGDDIQDIPIMRLIGIPIAVENAVDAVKEASVFVTNAAGGHGAVREVIERLLTQRGQLTSAYEGLIGAKSKPM